MVLIAPFGIKDEAVTAPGETASSEDDETGSFIGQAQPLVEHCEEVVEQAGRFAVSAGLPEPIISDLRLAGWLHDAGKADPRFQLLLADGDPFAMEEAGAVLAKSARGRSLPGAWGRAKLPAGTVGPVLAGVPSQILFRLRLGLGRGLCYKTRRKNRSSSQNRAGGSDHPR